MTKLGRNSKFSTGQLADQFISCAPIVGVKRCMEFAAKRRFLSPADALEWQFRRFWLPWADRLPARQLAVMNSSNLDPARSFHRDIESCSFVIRSRPALRSSRVGVVDSTMCRVNDGPKGRWVPPTGCAAVSVTNWQSIAQRPVAALAGTAPPFPRLTAYWLVLGHPGCSNRMPSHAGEYLATLRSDKPDKPDIPRRPVNGVGRAAKDLTETQQR
jgi:hypothetical protein